MGRNRLVASVVAAVLVVGVLGAVYYRTAWVAARDAAVSVVSGSETSLGPSVAQWGAPLGGPQASDVVVTTQPGWFALSPELSFEFLLTTPGRPGVQVPLGVSVDFSGTHWRLVGYGQGG